MTWKVSSSYTCRFHTGRHVGGHKRSRPAAAWWQGVRVGVGVGSGLHTSEAPSPTQEDCSSACNLCYSALPCPAVHQCILHPMCGPTPPPSHPIRPSWLALTWPSSEPDSMRGATAPSGPALGVSSTEVIVFWWLHSRRSRRPPENRSHTHSCVPPAVTSREPARQAAQEAGAHIQTRLEQPLCHAYEDAYADHCRLQPGMHPGGSAAGTGPGVNRPLPCHAPACCSGPPVGKKASDSIGAP